MAFQEALLATDNLQTSSKDQGLHYPPQHRVLRFLSPHGATLRKRLARSRAGPFSPLSLKLEGRLSAPEATEGTTGSLCARSAGKHQAERDRFSVQDDKESEVIWSSVKILRSYVEEGTLVEKISKTQKEILCSKSIGRQWILTISLLEYNSLWRRSTVRPQVARAERQTDRENLAKARTRA